MDAHISGSTFGEKGEVYWEEEEQQEGGQVGQHCACEAGREAVKQNKRLDKLVTLNSHLGVSVFHRRAVSQSGESQN